MKEAVLQAGCAAAIVAAAAALRLARLDHRPMHGDEAVQAVKFGRLLEHGEWIYDPREYHGPSLNLLTLPVARVAGARNLEEVTEVELRLVPAACGIALVALTWMVRRELGPGAALTAAALAALSPAMVFYSRYYIQETLLVLFSFTAMAALWRSVDCVVPHPSLEGSEAECPLAAASTARALAAAAWLAVLGISIGMMHATKETCVIPLGAMAVAAAVTMPWPRKLGRSRGAASCALVLLLAAAVSAVCFSSLWRHPAGIADSYRAFLHYGARASGQGSAGQHAYPWYQYFLVFFWWKHGGGPVWSELPIALLALVGAVSAARRSGRGAAMRRGARFLVVYTFMMAAVYSAIPYKTPWCGLGFLHGMILLAGVGAAALVRAAPRTSLKAAAIALAAAGLVHLGRQAWRASFAAADDPRNPYVYAHTSRDVLALVDEVARIAAHHPAGRELHIQVVCPDHDYWPLPWYLRRFRRIGWFGGIPGGPPAPLVITQPSMERHLVQYFYDTPPPGERQLYVRIPRGEAGGEWLLRPHVPLQVYATLELRDAWRAAGSGGDRP